MNQEVFKESWELKLLLNTITIKTMIQMETHEKTQQWFKQEVQRVKIRGSRTKIQETQLLETEEEEEEPAKEAQKEYPVR